MRACACTVLRGRLFWVAVTREDLLVLENAPEMRQPLSILAHRVCNSRFLGFWAESVVGD